MTLKRGFAALTPEQRREIGRAGGISAHQKGSAHRFNSDEAREAGRKGGKASQALGTSRRFTTESGREAGRRGGASVSKDREHMARIGRLGAAQRFKGANAGTTIAGPGSDADLGNVRRVAESAHGTGYNASTADG